MSLEFKNANLEDLTRLADLYKTVLGKEVDGTELNWRFFENPVSTRPFNLLCLDTTKEKLVGHTGFIPIMFEADGSPVRGALSAGSMVHPDYAGLFPELYLKLEAQMIEEGFDFLYAFPNANSFPFFRKYFGYRQEYFSVLKKMPDAKPALDIQSPLFQRGMQNAFSPTFQEWRFRHSPVYEYQWYFDHNCTCVYKKYKDEAIDVLYINDPAYLNNVLESLGSAYSECAVNIYSPQEAFTAQLQKAGFEVVPSPNKLVVKWINHQPVDAPFFQMADSDVF